MMRKTKKETTKTTTKKMYSMKEKCLKKLFLIMFAVVNRTIHVLLIYSHGFCSKRSQLKGCLVLLFNSTFLFAFLHNKCTRARKSFRPSHARY